MTDMGMTDKQFNLFLRFLQRALLEAKGENNIEEKTKKLMKSQKIFKNPQKNRKCFCRVRIPPAQPKSNPQQMACLCGLLRVFFCLETLLESGLMVDFKIPKQQCFLCPQQFVCSISKNHPPRILPRRVSLSLHNILNQQRQHPAANGTAQRGNDGTGELLPPAQRLLLDAL